MFKKLWLKFAKNALIWGVGFLYNYVDENSDGKLDKKEINEVIDYVRELFTEIKRKV